LITPSGVIFNCCELALPFENSIVLKVLSIFLPVEIELRPFDPTNLSSQDWSIYHEYRRKRHLETNPEDPILDDASAQKSLIVQFENPEIEPHVFAIFEPGNQSTQIGEFVYIGIRDDAKMFEKNKHLVMFNISLLPEYRRQGIGRNLLTHVYEYAKKNEKPIIISDTNESDGRGFFKSIGAQEALSNAQNRLTLEGVDWDMMQSWIDDGVKRSGGSKLQFFYYVPEEIIDPFAKFMTEVGNQAPFEELEVNDILATPEVLRKREEDYRKMGVIWLCLISVEENGDISGMTEISYRPEKETMISQGLTGVHEKYRGKGLGKMLKAAMLLRIQEEFPKVKIITTGNANSNAPMLAINERMGFKLHKVSVNAQIKTEDLGKYLKSRDLIPELTT
jgi:GNAT superfamily N-acetyltransferase